MKGADLNAVITQLTREKGIDRDVLIDAIKSAVLSAARKHFGQNLDLEVEVRESGDIEVLQYKTIVEKVVDPYNHISLDEARSMMPQDLPEEQMPEVGLLLQIPLSTEELGRIAAQSARQVIQQKVRDAEKGIIYEEFKESKGQIIGGSVLRIERGNVIVNLGKTEAILPKREQMRRERFVTGERIIGLVIEIDRSARGPQIVLSRSHPDFLRRLFEREVEDVGNGNIQIKAIAREPGDRAKVAVYTEDMNIDPVGACVGVRGSRVQAISQELRGERIDVILWRDRVHELVEKCLAPAEVMRFALDEEQRVMEVVVSDHTLSAAIGRGGQNVKLASKVTGWKIDVKSIASAEREIRRSVALLTAIDGILEEEAQALFAAGCRHPKELLGMGVSELVELTGLDEGRCSLIIAGAAELEFAKFEDYEEEDYYPFKASISEVKALKILKINNYQQLQEFSWVEFFSVLELPSQERSEGDSLVELVAEAEKEGLKSELAGVWERLRSSRL